MDCPNCHSNHIQKRGVRNNRQRMECQECGEWFTDNVDLDTNKIVAPRILVFDIETSLIELVGFGIHKQHISKEQITRDWNMISWSAKFLYDDEVFSDVLTPQESIAGKDKRIVKTLWDAIDSADIVITYNGNSFDIPRSQTRFLIHNLPPTSYFKSIDVYPTIANRFSFTSNSLDYVNFTLDLDRKKENGGLKLWKECNLGNPKALSDMEIYNRQDIVALEKMYMRVRPWINNHPNIGLYHDNEGSICKYCGSEDLDWSENPEPILQGKYKTFRCNNCTGIGRSRINLLTKKQRLFLMA